MEDSLNEIRLEKLFELNSENKQELPIFDLYDNVKDISDFILEFIYMLATVMFEHNTIFEYLYKYKTKISWIYDYFNKIKNQGIGNKSYNVIYSLHPEFVDIIEEGLIKRLELEPKIEVENFGNDDDGFNLI